MKKATAGDKVKVHYKGTLANGEVFDSSEGAEPLEFTLGSGMLIKGFDEGVAGMQVGETKKVNIPSEHAYGPFNDDLVVKVARANIPDDIPLTIGGKLNMHQDGAGQVMAVTIKEIAPEYVLLDANHGLAGQDLTFEIELVEVS